jgi:hypothetical protein
MKSCLAVRPADSDEVIMFKVYQPVIEPARITGRRHYDMTHGT